MQINDHLPIAPFAPAPDRYETTPFRRCGDSGVLLPTLSLGLWHNFGYEANFHTARLILRKAFDLGIVHFDLANNYGPPFGSAEANCGRILDLDFRAHRDELFIASKAGYDMWPGPYGNLGSRKYLLASVDQSLKRLGLDYVDVFYHHRPDPDTPLEETMGALAQIVRQGKALYVGISNYQPKEAAEACRILRELGAPCLIHQARYNMLDRWIEPQLLDTLEQNGAGLIAFSPLAQGLLTDKYLDGVPGGSRASDPKSYLQEKDVNQNLPRIQKLAAIAKGRGQPLSQMALSWLLRDHRVTSVLVGASSPEQLEQNAAAANAPAFSKDELSAIDAALKA